MTFPQDKNNWGPRARRSPTTSTAQHQTVVRGGWGIYYGRTSNSVISSSLTNNGVTFASYNFSPTSPGAPQYPERAHARPRHRRVKPSIQYLSPGLERPEINMAELTIDRAVGNDITVSASYLYSRGKHLPTFVDTNLPAANSTVEYFVDGTSRGTFPFYPRLRPDANINNAIEVADIVDVHLQRAGAPGQQALQHGLLFTANYTLSKSEDTGQNSTTFIANFASTVDPFDNDAEKGPRPSTAATAASSARISRRSSARFPVRRDRHVRERAAAEPHGLDRLRRAQRHRRVSTQSVNGSGASNRAPFDTRNGFRQTGPQDHRSAHLEGVQCRRDRKRIEALWEAFNVRTGRTTPASARPSTAP